MFWGLGFGRILFPEGLVIGCKVGGILGIVFGSRGAWVVRL